jgi:ParB family chromosome partitioning protein
MQTQVILVSNIERDHQQPRKLFDEAELAALSENMKSHGQQVPVIAYAVPGKFILLDGERRWRSARLAGLLELSAIVLPGRPSAGELAVLQASLDIHRASLTPMERSNLLARIREEKKWGVGELATQLSMKQSLVSKLLSYQKLAPELQEMLQAGKLDMEKAFILSSKDAVEQLALVASLGSMSRDELRSRKPRGDQPKASKAVFVLSSGLSITVQGQDVSLDDAISGLSVAVKELKRGLSQGLDITTAQRVMRDKAKAAV